jgi:NADH:ubiquinone oxidoreductase subunit E
MVEVKVCVGSSCHIRGGAKTLKVIKSLIESNDLADRVQLSADLCLDGCLRAPNVIVDGDIYGGITPDKAESFFNEQVVTRVNSASE